MIEIDEAIHRRFATLPAEQSHDEVKFAFAVEQRRGVPHASFGRCTRISGSDQCWPLFVERVRKIAR